MPILKANLRGVETVGIDVAAVANALAAHAPADPADLAAMIAALAPAATIADRAATSVADHKAETATVSNARRRSPSAKSCVQKSWRSPPSR